MIILDFIIWKLKPLWIIFFAFSAGAYFYYAEEVTTSFGQYLFGLGASVFCLICTFALILEKPKEKIIEKIITEEKIVNRNIYIPKKVPLPDCGIIYILKRKDGILKFGKTVDISSRVKQHKADYKTEFTPVTSWIVFNPNLYEKIALKTTENYSYNEGTRKELRKMTEDELSRFILSFTEKIQQDYNKLRRNSYV